MDQPAIDHSKTAVEGDVDVKTEDVKPKVENSGTEFRYYPNDKPGEFISVFVFSPYQVYLKTLEHHDNRLHAPETCYLCEANVHPSTKRCMKENCGFCPIRDHHENRLRDFAKHTNDDGHSPTECYDCQVKVHPSTKDCPDPECIFCSIRDCPFGCELHYDKDGGCGCDDGRTWSALVRPNRKTATSKDSKGGE